MRVGRGRAWTRIKGPLRTRHRACAGSTDGGRSRWTPTRCVRAARDHHIAPACPEKGPTREWACRSATWKASGSAGCSGTPRGLGASRTALWRPWQRRGTRERLEAEMAMSERVTPRVGPGLAKNNPTDTQSPTFSIYALRKAASPIPC